MRSLTISLEITEKEVVNLSLNELKNLFSMATVYNEWKRMLLCLMQKLCSHIKFLFIL